jgi:hypothetical protein
MLESVKTLKYQIAIACFFTLASPSCVWMKPAETRVSEARKDISEDYLKQIKLHKNGVTGEKLDITWKQGLERMYYSNPQLIVADYRLVDAKERQKQVWKNMIPGLSLGLSDSSTITDLGGLFSNGNFRINSFIALGNLLQLPKTLYTYKLTYMGSALQAENIMRQEVIALYRLFQEQRLHNIEKQALNLEAEILRSVSIKDDAIIQAMTIKHKESYEIWEENVKAWRVKVGNFFMSGFDEIILRPEHIPDIRYNPSDLDFSDTSRWGLLQLNILALESIAEDGRILNVYLRYLPRANLSVSAPPLFNNSRGQSFDPAAIRLGPSFNWSLDSRGSIGRQLDRLKRSKPLDDWRKDRRTREEVRKLFEGKQALKEIQEELKNLQQAIELYKKAVRSGLVKDPERAVQTMRGLKGKEVRLMAKEIEICSAFWLIDEQRWTTITKRWLQTRKNRTQLRKENTKSSELSFKNQVKKWTSSEQEAPKQ